MGRSDARRAVGSRLTHRPGHRLALVMVGWVAFVALLAPAVAAATSADTAASTPSPLVLFHSDSCPHCARERAFLQELVQRYPDLDVQMYEVGSAEARDLFVAMADELGFEARAVPTTILGQRVWVGFDDPTAESIEQAVAAQFAGRETDESSATNDASADAIVEVPLVGDVDLEDRSLLLSTLVIGFVDGFNPCSLWVLSILLALVLHTGSRSRVFAVGAVFLAVTTLLYGLFILGLYSALSYIAYVDWIHVAIALVAGVLGAVAIKDYATPELGPSLSIPTSSKPGIYARMRSLTLQRSLIGTLAATTALAVGVSLLETPCTAGLPLLWTDLLAASEVGAAAAVLLFGVYMAVFLVDELAVFALAVVTMRATKLTERHGRLLKLLSGVVMLALAGTMLLAPDALSDVRGAVAVFGGAAAVALLVAALNRRRLVDETPRRKGTGRRGGRAGTVRAAGAKPGGARGAPASRR